MMVYLDLLLHMSLLNFSIPAKIAKNSSILQDIKLADSKFVQTLITFRVAVFHIMTAIQIILDFCTTGPVEILLVMSQLT